MHLIPAFVLAGYSNDDDWELQSEARFGYTEPRSLRG